MNKKSLFIIFLIIISVYFNGCKSQYKKDIQKIPQSPVPQLQKDLKQMLEIDWEAGKPLPQGLQDNAVEVLDNWLISVGGFCGGRDRDWKPDKYPRGFLNKVWGLNLDDEKSGWVELPSLPADKRQGMAGVVVNNKLYVWGGFSYSAPYTYKDGYCLSQQDGKFVWKKMPQLPWATSFSAAYSSGSNIYLFGGFDYDLKRFYTEVDRSGKVKRLGARLIVLDTENIDAGWKELTSCPGTPRAMTTSAVIDNRFYSIGGVAVSDSGQFLNVIDTWAYNPESDTWSRLRDFPVSATGSNTTGLPVYKNRYILLPAGYQYKNFMYVSGTIVPKYGIGSIVKRTWHNHPHLKGVHYFNHFFVYDVKTNLFGTANNLPFDDADPPTLVIGNMLYMFPNETAGFIWEGEYFGHQPEFVVKAKIKELNWE